METAPIPTAGEATSRPPIEGPATGWAGPRPARLIGVAVAAGLLAGLGAWAVGETSAVQVRPVETMERVMGSGPLMPNIKPAAAASARRQTAARAFGVLGALTGLSLGVAGLLAGGPRRDATRGAGLGLVVGGLAGAACIWLAMMAIQGDRPPGRDDLVQAFLLHAIGWVPAGLAGGLALAIATRGRPASGLAGGLVGVLLATLIYEVAGGAAFPLAKTSDVVSATWESRLLARLLVPTLAAAGAAWMISRPPAGAKAG